MLKKIILAVLALSGLAASAAIPAGHIRIHYQRPDNSYTGWTVYAFGDTTENTSNYRAGPVAVSGTDSYGVYFDVGIVPNAENVGLIIHNPTASGGDIKDPGPNEFLDPSAAGNEFWAIAGIDQLYKSMPNVAAEPGLLQPRYARIHYYRPDGNYNNWTLYSFDNTQEPTNNFNEGPLFVTGTDAYGAFFDVKITNPATDLGFIVHNVNTGVKDPGQDMHLALTSLSEAWVISGDQTVYTTMPTAVQILNAGFSRLQAYWIDRQTLAIAPAYVVPNRTYQLVYSANATLQITSSYGLTGALAIPLTPASLSAPQLHKYPQLSSYAAFHLPANGNVDVLKAALKGQIAVAAFDGSTLKYITGVQTAGVLDDLFYYSGPLGGIFNGEHSHGSTVSVWAPTAQLVQLLLFHSSTDSNPASTVVMTENNGVWSAQLDNSWRNQYYLFNVTVYVPSLHKIVTNTVTDPYSTDLALNGSKSRLTDLNDPRTKPDEWDEHHSPEIRSKNELTIWELHVRDFSADDSSVPTERRGTYLAFADSDSNGMRHLQRLAKAGLKAVHLLPTFHIASINEDKTTWKAPGDLSGYPPDGQDQQAAVAAVQNQDAYNWGYDPVHYMAPEGAYAVNPEDRVKEYREMVQGLHRTGLRVIQDQVFNHTTSSGQSANSVLDQIVPAYYYRLDGDGNVLNSSCCADTASEHMMMEKLMIDSIVQNARQYKIDGFRFDLMSFHFVFNMLHIQNALSQLTVGKDGVDGSKIYLYGEGWTTGETANNALGPNASQANMYGTGIGTFNDRIRDGVRGGGPFSDQRVQGFSSGLYTDSSVYTQGSQSTADQLNTLLSESDWIRSGLAGNMRDFTFANSQGQVATSASLNYGGQRVGYTAAPIESVNYCSVHDNQALFDALQLKSSSADNIASRARRQVLAMSIIALGQGIPFFLAGDELLRSKDMDNNSYNAGDWFNKIDFTYQSNNWGVGLPLAADNKSNWPIMQPLLADLTLKASSADITNTRDAFEALLRIRGSSGLFHMQTLPEIQANLHFLNTGPQQIPGVIGMRLDANGGAYGPYQHILVVFNATTKQISLQDSSLKGLTLRLHSALGHSSDSIVKSATFDATTGFAAVPALTTAVFVN